MLIETSAHSRLRARLKRETAALHNGLEASLGLGDSTLSLDRYRRLLESFFGYHAPIEARIARGAPRAPPLGFDVPARATLLLRDLVALGSSPADVAALPRCTDLPPVAEPAHLAGCLYVLEGARLGGRIIARELERTLGLGPDDGLGFFWGDDEDVTRRWKRVLAWLDEVACSGALEDEIVASACETFRTLSRWTEARGTWR